MKILVPNSNFSSCGRDENRCCERMSRLYIHECRSLETCGMSSSHILHILGDFTVEEPGNSYYPARGFTHWPGGNGCDASNPNRPGHCLKLISGRGQHGSAGYTRGLKMMETAFLARACHPPVSSYLQGSSDIVIKLVR